MVNGEVGGVEDEEPRGRDDVDGNLGGAGEGAGGEVGLEEEIVAPGGGEFGEPRLALELLHAMLLRHPVLSLALSLSPSLGEFQGEAWRSLSGIRSFIGRCGRASLIQKAIVFYAEREMKWK